MQSPSAAFDGSTNSWVSIPPTSELNRAGEADSRGGGAEDSSLPPTETLTDEHGYPAVWAIVGLATVGGIIGTIGGTAIGFSRGMEIQELDYVHFVVDNVWALTATALGGGIGWFRWRDDDLRAQVEIELLRTLGDAAR